MPESQKPQAKALTKSTEVIESYIFSTSSRNFSIYSERLLMRIVSLAQVQLLGASFRDGTDIGQVSIGALGEATVEIPIRSLLGDGNTNYSQAKRAIMELMSSPYYVERPKMRGGEQLRDEDGNLQFEFVGRQILNSCDINVKPGVAVVEVNKDTWKAILDLSKGYRRYVLEVGMKLKLSTSLRLFRLLSNQQNPVTYSIEKLREMWEMNARDPETGEYLKYPDTYNFIHRTIEPAKKELDEKSPWSFDYVKNYAVSSERNTGRRGKKAVTSVTFIPKRRADRLSTSDLAKMVGSPVSLLGREAVDLLVNKFGFTQKGIMSNILTFKAATEVGMDLVGFLYELAPKALRVTSPQGYVINSVNIRLKERYGVDISASGFVIPASPGGK